MRVWVRPDGYVLVVVVTQYAYEVLAGLALGTFDGGAYPAIEVSGAGASIHDLQAVTIRGSAHGDAMVYEGFRRGRQSSR